VSSHYILVNELTLLTVLIVGDLTQKLILKWRLYHTKSVLPSLIRHSNRDSSIVWYDAF